MNDRFKFRIWRQENPFVENWQPKYVYLTLGSESGFCKTDIIEQCTGLKDKNGRLIYEGDIVEIMVWDDTVEDMVETKGKVYWSREDAAFLINVSYDAEYSLNSHETFYGQEIEVIGNIHENKELLDE